MCSQNLSLSFAQVEALSDGLLHEDFCFEATRCLDTEKALLSSAPWCFDVVNEPTLQGKPQARTAPRVADADNSAGRATRVLAALKNETPTPPQRLTVFISQVASFDIPRHGGGTASKFLNIIRFFLLAFDSKVSSEKKR